MKAVPAAALAIVGLAGVARAQPAETGAIEGRVVRPATGRAVAGEVVVDDTARFWRTRARIGDDGRFAVPALLPGTYTLQFDLGHDTGLLWYVVVDAGRTTRLVADLDAGKVRIGAPVEPGTTLFDHHYLTDIPRTSQTFDGAMGAAPGARGDGYGVSYGGATSLENRYYLDGLDTTELVFGQVGTRIPDELVDQIRVTTAGAGPEFGGAEGGFVAVTTRHGTNELHGGVYAAFAPAALVGHANAAASGQSISVATKPGDTADFAAELGGPLVRDHAWFYVAFAPELAHTDQVRTISRQTDCHILQGGKLSPCEPQYGDGVPDVDPRTGQPILDPVDSEIRSDTSDAYTLLGRIDVAPTAGQQGSLTALVTPSTGTYPGLYGLASSGTRAWDMTSDLAARWTATLSGGALVLDAGLGWHRDRFDSASIDPALDGTPQQILEGGSLSTLVNLGGESAATVLGCHDGGANDPYPYITNCPVSQYAIGGPGVEEHDLDDRRTAHLAVTARVHAAGLHELTAGVTGELDAAQRVDLYSGGAAFTNLGGIAIEDTQVRFAPPGSTDPAFDRMCYDTSAVPIRVYRCQQITSPVGDPASRALLGAAYLRDRWHPLPGLVVDLGARYSAQRLDLAPAVAGTVDPRTMQTLPHTLLDLELVEPRLGVTYDPTGEGRATVFAHWGRYGETMLDNLVTAIPGFVGYSEDLALSGCPVDPRLGVPDATTCAGTLTAGTVFSAERPPRVAPGLQPGYVDELTAGGEVEAAQDLDLGATIVDRRLGRAIEDTQDATGAFVLVNPGESPEQGRALDKPERQYDALELTVARRFSRLYVLASYTYSQTRGGYAGDISYGNGQLEPHESSQYDLPQLDANRFGPLPQDRPHLFKLDAAYTQPVGRATAIIVGGRLRITSGTPELVLGSDAFSGPDEIYLLPPGALGRTPASEELDAHLAVRHRFARGVTLEAFADVINVLDAQTVYGVDQTYASAFNSGSLAISGGDYSDLIWAKQLDASGNETSRPLARNTQFGQPTGWYAPIAARFGVRLTF